MTGTAGVKHFFLGVNITLVDIFDNISLKSISKEQQ